MRSQEIAGDLEHQSLPPGVVIPWPRLSEESTEPRPLPEFDLTIAKQKVIGSKRVPGNCEVEFNRFKLSDGSSYKVNIYTPERPRFDTPVRFGTPWWTDLEGFNDDHVGQELAANGFYAIGVSPEQSSLPRAALKLAKAYLSYDGKELAHDAEAEHAILDWLQTGGRMDTSQLFSISFSRDAMINLGLQAYAGKHGREFIFNDNTDPCLEHGIKRENVRYRELPGYFKKELGAFGVALAGEHDRHLWRLLKTLKLSPAFVLSQLATGSALFHGEAGHFVDHLPPDSNTHITLFHGSIFNHAASWHQRLDGFPGVEFSDINGYHLSGVAHEISTAAIGRLLTQAEKLA